MNHLVYILIFYFSLSISPSIYAFTLINSNPQLHLFEAFSGEIGNRVWHDRNGNGIQDNGEPGISGVTVLIFDAQDVFIGITTTDNSGNYIFSGLASGQFRIKFPQIEGLKLTKQGQGSASLDSDVNMEGFTSLINITDNQTNLHIDAGYTGTMVLGITSSIQTCEGSPVTLSAQAFHGKAPYTYSWSNGLGTGNPVSFVAPVSSTTYRVTVTDYWGTQLVASTNVRVKAGVGEEQCQIIDDFFNGHNGLYTLEVNPTDPGPKSEIQTANIGLLGNSRNIIFEYIDGTLPANITVDFTIGEFTNSNDVGSISKTTLCYNNYGQGINFDISPFDYIKFKDIAVDQGGIDVKVSFWDGNNRISEVKSIPGLGTNSMNNQELVFADIQNFQGLDLEKIQEICFEFTTNEQSVDFQLAALMTCKTTDCELDMGADSHICAGDSVLIKADLPCAENLIYLWDNGLSNQPIHMVSPTQTTTYKVTVIDINGCSVNGSITVYVHPQPDVILPQITEVCHGQIFSLIPTYTSGSAPFSYQWSNGTQLPVLTDLIALQNELFQVNITDHFGCADSASTQLVVLQNPELSFITVPADCQQSNGRATVEVSGGQAPYTYLWSNGDTDEVLNNVSSGYYHITVVDNKGCEASGQVFVNELYCAKIGDYVWHDLNADGIQNADEPGIPNVRVELLDQNQQIMNFTLTNENGYYIFSALAPGDYFIRFISPANFHLSIANSGADPLKDSNANPTTGLTGIINIDNYEEDLSIDAGLYQFGKLGDLVWLDNDGNGIQNSGETGVSGVLVSLLDCNGAFLKNTNTDTNGNYMFADLVPGQYKIRFNAPSGMKFIGPNQGSDPTIDSDPTILTGETGCLTLISNQINLNVDAGVYTPAKIGDRVWLDLNADGQQSADEPGFADFEIRLLDCNGAVIKTTFTDAQGNYLFDDLLPGSYKIGLNTLGSYELSPYKTGDPALDSDINPITNTSDCEILISGEINLTYDIGLFQRATIGDIVWIDGNGNGIHDTGETGYTGMVVQLFHCDNNLVAQTITNSSGVYNFTNLLPGNYSVKFNLNNGWHFTQPGVGNNTDFDSNADPVTGLTGCETLISGEINNSYDAGIYQLAKLGDFVWEDLNGNGIQDIGEPGVNNFKVLLKTCSGILVDTKFTDQFGYYVFENMIPGSYLLDFSQNSEPYFTSKNQGTNTDIDSDVNPSNGQTSCFEVSTGSTNYTVDAGLLKVCSVGDFIWEDINGNGIQDNGEPGIEGIVAKLYRFNPNGTVYIGETTSDENGYYVFQDIAPGTYHIKFDLVGTNWQVTFPDVNSDFVDSDVNHANGFNSTSNFVLLPGQHNPDVDAGLYLCAEIGDLVWCDFTPNHYWESGENGINGVEVSLYRKIENTWVFWTSVETANETQHMPNSGYWSDCVIPGEYYAKFNLPENSNFLLVDPFIGGNSEYDSDVTNAFGHGTTNPFFVLSGETKTDLAAGYYYGSIIGDKVWYDSNQNGLQDAGEPPASGILVELFGVNGKVGQEITNSNGNFMLDNIVPGAYYLKFSPATYQFTTPNVGGNDHIDSDVTNANGIGTTNWINIVTHETNYSFDAGLINTPNNMQWNGQGGSFEGDHNHIWWETLDEDMMERFELQRKHPDSDQFDLLDIIQPKGKRNLLQKYEVQDFNIEKTGMYKYRILSRDLFSNDALSPEILINVLGKMKMVLYPNPASEKINLGFFNEDIDEIRINMYNNLGILVKSFPNITLDKNSVFYKEITVEDLPSGNYHLTINGADINWNANISVMR